MLTIRPMTDHDTAVVGEIYRQSWRATFGHLLSQSYYGDERIVTTYQSLLSEPHVSFVACVDDVVCGWVRCQPETGELGQIYVHPNYWGHGIGTQLFYQAIDVLDRNRPIFLWVWEHNTRAQIAYQHWGWFAGEERYTVYEREVPFVMEQWLYAPNIDAL